MATTIDRCDFCLEVDIFHPLITWDKNEICQVCADEAQAELDAKNRAHDQQ